jgi:FtsZ-binding cell division protein ZapB
MKSLAQILQVLVPVALAYIAYLQFAKKSKRDETNDLIDGYKQQIESLKEQNADIYQKYQGSEAKNTTLTNENYELRKENYELRGQLIRGSTNDE